MIKKLKIIYTLIFISSLLLAIVSLIDYTLTNINIKWAVFVLGVIIMILSLTGYYLVEKSTLTILANTEKKISKRK
ncbi:hypothetical protein J4209_06360 [Candidatus Woesearchaeota archaeon]|nr:hypothetical protein [Candidatus Woesearchaeota archaeon]